MSASEFVAETQKYIDSRRKTLKQYLELLGNTPRNTEVSITQTKNDILSYIESNISHWATFSDTSSKFETYAAEFTESSIAGNTASEDIQKQNRNALATLGAIFATEPKAPHFLAKKTANEVESIMNTRQLLLSEIDDNISKLNTEINLIDGDWYSNFMDDTNSAKVQVDNAISNLLTVRSFINNQSAINDGELGLAKDRILSAVDHISKCDSSASITNILYYAEELDNKADELTEVDINAKAYVDNLIAFKAEFNNNSTGNNRFLGYVKEVSDHQYKELLSISKSMEAAIEKNSVAVTVNKSSDWIIQLMTIAGSINHSVVDYGASINDSSDADTILLDTFISSLDSSGRVIDSTIPNYIKNATGEARRLISNETSKINFNTFSSTVSTKVSDQNSVTATIKSDCRIYGPSEIESITEFLTFINNIDLDRAKSVLLSSRWASIFKLNDLSLDFPTVIAQLIGGFIDSIDDIELRERIKSLHYKIQADKRNRTVLGLTFDSLRQSAINNMNTTKMRELDELQAQLEIIDKKLS